MGYRYYCAKCKKSFVSHDSEIIRQLPEMLQCEYPGYMTHRSGLSKPVGDLYRSCVQNSVGPKRFSKILREMHMLKYSRRRLQYLQAIFFRRKYPTLEQKPIVSFSQFDDRLKYAGHLSSPQYLRSFYTSFIGEMRHLMDKQMQALDGIYLKGDHTFKIIKLMNKANRQPVFAALYTLLNEYEEVRLQYLVPNKSMEHLRYALTAMRDAYELYGY